MHQVGFHYKIIKMHGQQIIKNEIQFILVRCYCSSCPKLCLNDPWFRYINSSSSQTNWPVGCKMHPLRLACSLIPWIFFSSWKSGPALVQWLCRAKATWNYRTKVKENRLCLFCTMFGNSGRICYLQWVICFELKMLLISQQDYSYKICIKIGASIRDIYI
jgi:hypothetical protein